MNISLKNLYSSDIFYHTWLPCFIELNVCSIKYGLLVLMSQKKKSGAAEHSSVISEAPALS